MRTAEQVFEDCIEWFEKPDSWCQKGYGKYKSGRAVPEKRFLSNPKVHQLCVMGSVIRFSGGTHSVAYGQCLQALSRSININTGGYHYVCRDNDRLGTTQEDILGWLRKALKAVQ